MNEQADSGLVGPDGFPLSQETPDNSEKPDDSKTTKPSGNLPTDEELAELKTINPTEYERLRRLFQVGKDRGVDEAVKTAKAASEQSQMALDMIKDFAAAAGITDPAKIQEVTKNFAMDRMVKRELGELDGETSAQPDSTPASSELVGSEASKQANSMLTSSISTEIRNKILEEVRKQPVFRDYAALSRFVLDKTFQLTTKPAPTGASKPTDPGSVPLEDPDDQTELMNAFRAEFDKADQSLKSEVKRKYRAKGLKV